MTKLHDVNVAHRRYWKDGLTLRQVASEYGMDYSALCRRFTQAGLPRRRKGQRGNPAAVARAQEMEHGHEREGRYLDALGQLGSATVAEFAAEVGTTPQAALYHLNKFTTLGHVEPVGRSSPRRYRALTPTNADLGRQRSSRPS